ncbi:hypothetical protein AMTR_s00104p00115110 [Amborella trichopoda]|uniref:Aminotransferase-like plant mobile domain-containing protein n=1 Tax=Amborella trichopoda TaxID=13333 RepID=W1NYI9_AMBTC|nr:hypothetical protein AMTR_s00104p00115110 [Amborella trichopoda]
MTDQEEQFLGGHEILTLLKQQKSHISQLICNGHVTGNAFTLQKVDNYNDFIFNRLVVRYKWRYLTNIILAWLREKINVLPQAYNQRTLERYICAYLLYLIGVTIFADAIQGVSMIYLQLFDDIDAPERYVLGATALAFLFRSLSKLVSSNHCHLSSSRTLLLVSWTPYEDELDIGEEDEQAYAKEVHAMTLCCTYLISGTHVRITCQITSFTSFVFANRYMLPHFNGKGGRSMGNIL